MRKEEKERKIADWEWDYCYLTFCSFLIVEAEILDRVNRTIDEWDFHSVHDEWE